MEPLPLPDLQKLPQAAGFPRADSAQYLGDHVIRRVLNGDQSNLPDGIISAGIGSLRIGAEITYQPKVRPKPGEILKILIRELIGVEALPKCKCAERAQLMNEWGWSGCWQHRRKIINWLKESAKEVQRDLDAKKAMTILQAIAIDGFLVLARHSR